MTQYPYDLKSLRSQSQVQMAAQILIDAIYANNIVNKELGKDFFNKVLANFENQKASAQLKYFTLLIFKYFDSKQKSILKIFSVLPGHAVFNYFVDVATNVDPNKAVKDKGKKLFAQNPQIGMKFMRLLLQSLKIWGQKYPRANGADSKYKKAYVLLQQQKITFPSTYQYYSKQPQPLVAGQQKQTPGNPIQTNKSSIQQKQIIGQIRFLYNKIQLLIGLIQDQGQDDIEEFQKEIHKNHLLFQKEQKRLENTNVFQVKDQLVVALFLKINQFFNCEQKIYQDQITKSNDLKMYCDRIIIDFDRIFTEEQKNRKSERPSQPMIKQQVKTSSIKQKQKYNSNASTVKDVPSVDKTTKVQSVINQKQKTLKQKQKPAKPKQTSKIYEQSRGMKDSQKSKQLNGQKIMQSFFQKLQKEPKSVPGFKAIKQSLQKDKSLLKQNHPRQKSPLTASNLSRSKFQASTVSNLQIRPPNLNCRTKRYEGQVVGGNVDLEIMDIHKDQGVKRFKLALLKQRALLFEDQFVQIGFRSQVLYDKLEQYQEIIQFELFIGNKSSETIRNLDIRFQGDQKSLVYSNPQKAPQSLSAKQQYKFQVIVIPRSQCYSLTSIKLQYKIESSLISTSCILPSSILKFSSYIESTIGQLKQQQSQFQFYYQTQKFKLSHYFAPKKIRHYIQELKEITTYQQFMNSQSQIDFVLMGSLMLKEKYMALLKINVRPDFNVVIQLKTNQQQQQAIKDLKFYMQSLMMLLKQTR